MKIIFWTNSVSLFGNFIGTLVIAAQKVNLNGMDDSAYNHHQMFVFIFRYFKQLKCYDGLLESSFMFMMQAIKKDIMTTIFSIVS